MLWYCLVVGVKFYNILKYVIFVIIIWYFWVNVIGWVGEYLVGSGYIDLWIGVGENFYSYNLVILF